MTRFMGPTSGPSGADSTQLDPMLAPWILLSVIALVLGSWEVIVLIVRAMLQSTTKAVLHIHIYCIYIPNSSVYFLTFRKGVYQNSRISNRFNNYWFSGISMILIKHTKQFFIYTIDEKMVNAYGKQPQTINLLHNSLFALFCECCIFMGFVLGIYIHFRGCYTTVPTMISSLDSLWW